MEIKKWGNGEMGRWGDDENLAISMCKNTCVFAHVFLHVFFACAKTHVFVACVKTHAFLPMCFCMFFLHGNWEMGKWGDGR